MIPPAGKKSLKLKNIPQRFFLFHTMPHNLKKTMNKRAAEKMDKLRCCPAGRNDIIFSALSRPGFHVIDHIG